MHPLCQHTLLEYELCDLERLKKARAIKALLCQAVIDGGGTIVKTVFHNFQPYGVSGVVVITESHVTIHTWPEYGYAAVDIFSCSAKLDHKAIAERLKQMLSARRMSRKSFWRGFRPAIKARRSMRKPLPVPQTRAAVPARFQILRSAATARITPEAA